MHKSNILVVVAVVLGASAASAQTTGTRLGLKGGASISTLSGTLNAEPSSRIGVAFGPMLRFNPSRQHFAVQAELLFSTQGANLEIDNGTASRTVSRDAYYLNLPILLRQYFGGPVYFNVGPQLGLLLGPEKAELKPLDVSLAVGLGVETKGGFVAEARYNYGFVDVENNSADRAIRARLGLGGLHNRVIQLSVGYLFGKK